MNIEHNPQNPNHWFTQVSQTTTENVEAVSEVILTSADLQEVAVEASAAKRRPGRPSLPPEERARRKKLQQEANQQRQLARRKAMGILAERHPEEFEALLAEAMNGITV